MCKFLQIVMTQLLKLISGLNFSILSKALDKVFHSGKNGDRYNVGSNTELTNLELVKKICTTYDNIKGLVPGTSSRLISFVGDRPGHDLRYSINIDKIYTKLRWKPEVNFNLGMAETVKSYL